MKTLSIIGIILFLAGCGRTTEIVEYRQVTVAPMVETVSVVEESPIDVTETTVEYW